MSIALENEPLHLKYRPSSFDSFIGNKAVAKAIEKEIARKDRGHAYLVCGPSGSGKTSLSRIMARHLTGNYLEFDGPSIREVENIRNIVREVDSSSGFRIPRTIIVDEAQAITSMGWQTFLKTIEETPDHVYFIFCTTEISKVPNTIQSRCRSFMLSRPKRSEMEALLETVSDIEKIDKGFVGHVINKADGNMRAALSFLSLVRDCESVEEVRSILGSVELESTIFLQLCKEIITGTVKTTSIVLFYKQFGAEPPESVRLKINSWLLAALERGSEDPDTILHSFTILEGMAYDWSDILGKLYLLVRRSA